MDTSDFFSQFVKQIINVMKRIIIFVFTIIAISFNLAAQPARSNYLEQQKPAWSGEYSRWRIDINGGYGARLGKMAETGDEYMLNHASRLKYGFEYNGGVSYFSPQTSA